MKLKLALTIILVGLLSACASPATEAPASQPTEASAPVIETATAAPATEAPAPAAPTGQVGFSKDVLPILESRCVSCHGGDRTAEGLNLKNYASLMSGSENGPVITAGDSTNSLLAELVSNQKMPKRGPKLTPAQLQLIMDWIDQGALDN
jgi:mono/diheme cytochrome c family protein